jgi:hypothetical protein
MVALDHVSAVRDERQRTECSSAPQITNAIANALGGFALDIHRSVMGLC